MELIVDFSSDLTNEKYNKFIDTLYENNHLENYIKKVLELEEIESNRPLYLSLLLTDNRNIQVINREYRDKDAPTDVISFALNDEVEDEIDIIGLEDEINSIGDVIICVDIAHEQAKEYEHSFDREIGFLAVHGFLHLLGYDHMTEEDEKEMFGKQDEILEKYPNIIPKFFDCSLKEEDEFLSALQINSIFKTVDFLVLKRSENLKSSGIQKLFKSIKNYNLDEKNIIIIYNVPIQYGKVVSDYELTKPSIKLIEELATFKDCTVIKESKATLNYVKQNLNITEKDAKEFIKLLGDDYYHIKNETNKVATFLEGQPYSFEKIKNLISIDKEYNMKDLIENFLKTKNFSDIINFLEKNKDSYLGLIYMLTDELINLLKLASLIKSGKISRNMNYNVFKELYNDFSDLFIGKNFKAQHPYTIFLKLNSSENFSEEFLEKKLKELLEIEYKVKSGERDIDIETEVFLGKFFK